MSDIIPNVVVSMPNQLFTLARKFQAVSNGKIFIGEVDTDPVIPENQIQVYLENEDGTTVPVPQPLIINQAGYPVYNGKIAKFVTVQGHSMAVYDSYGAQQFYYPNILKYDPDQFSVWAKNNFELSGYTKVDPNTFSSGATLTAREQALFFTHDGNYYTWHGAFPKIVPPSSTPYSTGGVSEEAWVMSGSASLRGDLNLLNNNVFPIRGFQNLLSYKLKKQPRRSRFVTFNIYTGDTINNRFNGDFTSMDRVLELQECIISMGASVVGMQEFYSLTESNVNSYKINPLSNAFFGEAGALNNNRLYGNSMLSSYSLNNTESHIYQSEPSSEDSEMRGYIKAEIDISGVTVIVINTHLSTDNSRAKAMILELAAIITSDTSGRPYILMGDWNISSEDAFKPLTDIGFSRANNNRYNTANNNEGWSAYIDDILYRGVSFVDSGVFEIPVSISDHKPFYLDFEVLI